MNARRITKGYSWRKEHVNIYKQLSYWIGIDVNIVIFAMAIALFTYNVMHSEKSL